MSAANEIEVKRFVNHHRLLPQGSFLGPLLFNLYMLPLGNIISKYKMYFNFFADDSQLYVSLKSRLFLEPLMDCLKDIKRWMANHFLQ